MSSEKFYTEKAKKSKNTGYISPERNPDEVRLFYNELQYPPSPKVNEVFAKYAENSSEMQFYGDPNASKLCAAIAEVLGIDPEYVYADASSDRVLDMVHKAFLEGKRVAYPNPSYGFYKAWSEFYDVDATFIDLKEDLTLNLEDYRGFEAVVIANPNAPTGRAIALSEIEDFVESNPDTLMVVDEAYIAFADVKSAAPLVSKYENVLVTQTFSKAYALANMRIGYAIGNPDLLAAIRGVRSNTNEIPLSNLAIDAGAAAIRDQEYYRDIWQKVKATRGKFTNELRALGIRVVDSEANFVFAEFPDGKGVYDYLSSKEFRVRLLGKRPYENYLRISIGTESQMEEVIKCLKTF